MLETSLKKSKWRTNEMVEYLNSLPGEHNFKLEYIEAIDMAIKKELRSRQNFINGKYLLNQEKHLAASATPLNQRIANVANNILCRGDILINKEMVALYKKAKSNAPTNPIFKHTKKVSVSKNIAEIMTMLHGNRTFTRLEAATIGRAINKEQYSRAIISKNEDSSFGLKTRVTKTYRTKAGKRELNKRVASIANQDLFLSDLDDNAITGDIVRLFKYAREVEYEKRCNKCSWRLKKVRKSRGFNEETGERLPDKEHETVDILT